ncbi:MAG: PAS domain-containing sensor histidine kinase [Ignavibacteria bacterium]|nr:PAS domain-containing sensor histidine kinase [Ignavibacteria bacterium]
MNNKDLDYQENIIENSLAEESFKHLLETPLPVLLIKRDKFSRYILHSFNQLAQEIFAVPLERLINKEIRIFWPKESWDDFRKGVIAAIRKGLVSDVGSVFIQKEGKTRSFNLKIWQVGNSIACCIFLETIDKKILLQSVLDERLKYEELFKNTPVMMTNIDLDGKIVDANFFWLEKTGYEKNEIIGKNILDYFFIDENSLLNQKTFSELLIKNELKNLPVKVKKKNGETISSVITARPLFDINGKFIRCYLVAHDISELHSLKEAFENTDRLLKSLLESSASAILLYSLKNGIVECNQKAEELFAVNKEKIVGKKLSDLEELEEFKFIFEKLNEILMNSLNQTEKFEIEVNPNGNKKFFEISITKIHLKDEPFVLIFFSDKSTEKIKDVKIRESEKRFETLFEESINALKLIDNSGRVIKLNKKARELFGEFIDKSNRVQIKTKEFDYQKWLKEFISSSNLQDQCEYKFKTQTGVKIIDEKLMKISFDSGEKIIFSIGREVTNERLAEEELRKSEQNLRNLNDTKNRLIHILSHDLRAPTSSIIGVINTILDEPNIDKKEISNYLKLVKSAASYQLDLINNLLDWSLLDSGKFNYTLEAKNLEYAVYNSLNSIRGLIEQKKIKVDVKVDSELVLIDLNLFSRILINLVSNAVKFSYPESKIYVYSKKLNNHRIEICVKDNGVGFDKEVLEKLFTFKEKVSRRGTSGERGTGLGLSLCKDIAKIFGGKLKIESPIKTTSKKSGGSLVCFDLKLVEPKVLISSSLNKTSIKNSLKREIKDYNFVFKNLIDYFKNEVNDYFLFVILHEKEVSNSLIEKILNVHLNKKNIIVVFDKQTNQPNELKTTQLENLPTFLRNEIDRIEFEWKQQVSLARQMRKIWD